MSEKSILEQALLQVQTLEEAVKQNAKGILASTMKQELNDLLKESLEEEEKVADEEVSEQPTPDEEETDDMSDDESENEDDLDNDEPNKDIDSMDSSDDDMGSDEMGSDDEMSSDDDMDSEDDMGSEDMDSEDMGSEDDMASDDVVDMTDASDEEVLKIFKAMKPEDGIVVKKDGEDVSLDLGDDEYIIKLDEEGVADEEVSEELYEEETNEADSPETMYEIELDEEDEVSEKEEKEEATEEVEATEAARTKSNPHGNKGGQDRSGLPSKKMYKAGSGVVNEELSKLKKQNEEYKKALVLFKDKLNEVAVFNASLAYATRLFTEHSTTKQEKLNILKRFDKVSSMNESKNLYSAIKTELDTKKPVTESVVDKISNTPSTSSSQEVLSESKAYENPQFRRMKDLMAKIK